MPTIVESSCGEVVREFVLAAVPDEPSGVLGINVSVKVNTGAIK